MRVDRDLELVLNDDDGISAANGRCTLDRHLATSDQDDDRFDPQARQQQQQQRRRDSIRSRDQPCITVSRDHRRTRETVRLSDSPVDLVVVVVSSSVNRSSPLLFNARNAKTHKTHTLAKPMQR